MIRCGGSTSGVSKPVVPAGAARAAAGPSAAMATASATASARQSLAAIAVGSGFRPGRLVMLQAVVRSSQGAPLRLAPPVQVQAADCCSMWGARRPVSHVCGGLSLKAQGSRLGPHGWPRSSLQRDVPNRDACGYN